MKKYRIEYNIGGRGRISIEADSIQEILEALAEDDIKKLQDVIEVSKLREPYRGVYVSAQEMLKKVQPSTTVDKLMLFIYWLWKGGFEIMNVSDIGTCFIQCRELPPINLNHMMNYLTKKGFLMESGMKESKKAWGITNTGINYVENILLHP